MQDVPPLTFVVQRAIEVVTAGVEARGQLNEMAGPRVAGAREAGECDELLGLGWEEPSVHAPIVCRRTDRQGSAEYAQETWSYAEEEGHSMCCVRQENKTSRHSQPSLQLESLSQRITAEVQLDLQLGGTENPATGDLAHPLPSLPSQKVLWSLLCLEGQGSSSDHGPPHLKGASPSMEMGLKRNPNQMLHCN